MLESAFMTRAMLAGVIVSLLLSVLGFFILLRKMSFIGVGIAHAAFGGVALGQLLGVPVLVSAAFFSVATGVGIGAVTRNGRIKEDTAIGIFFAAGMALGILFIYLKPGYSADIISYLFGSILAVTGADLWIIAIVSTLVLGLILLFFKELLASSFDAELARVSGIPERFLFYLLLGLVSLGIVVSIKIVGIVLVSALLVLPAATALQYSRRWLLVVFLAVLFGLIYTIGGLIASYWLDIPSGATIVILGTIIFLVSLLFSPVRRGGKSKVPT
ncbi:iron chelate uptake ABC transporter family permease subunit [candidate division WOR-3 bacterium]|uniref:Iron chelate uptake ABC transporter family permease subunit n=1 Tax=candidate division WOR-3 bacterium TaxID=2052148 RepID=A0A9D5K836_UNCW3|nr:iron chelate uptake ABC transporter family permease subunit [candidate division WOR-3 bacterium]MBD3364156.1 iron chelate uptake ABC transporter family permease subunit [candidate division WOR-3 bacterium]